MPGSHVAGGFIWILRLLLSLFLLRNFLLQNTPQSSQICFPLKTSLDLGHLHHPEDYHRRFLKEAGRSAVSWEEGLSPWSPHLSP